MKRVTRKLTIAGLLIALAIGQAACSSEHENRVGSTPDHIAEIAGNAADPEPEPSPTETAPQEPPAPTPTLTKASGAPLGKPYSDKAGRSKPLNPCDLVSGSDIATVFGFGVMPTSRDGYALNWGSNFSGDNGSELTRVKNLAGNRSLCYYRDSNWSEPLHLTVITEAYRYTSTAKSQYRQYGDMFDGLKKATFSGDEGFYANYNYTAKINGKKVHLRLTMLVIRVNNRLTMLAAYAPDTDEGMGVRTNLETIGQTAAERMG